MGALLDDASAADSTFGVTPLCGGTRFLGVFFFLETFALETFDCGGDGVGSSAGGVSATDAGPLSVRDSGPVSGVVAAAIFG